VQCFGFVLSANGASALSDAVVGALSSSRRGVVCRVVISDCVAFNSLIVFAVLRFVSYTLRIDYGAMTICHG
jgi:hypothetical protein